MKNRDGPEDISGIGERGEINEAFKKKLKDLEWFFSRVKLLLPVFAYILCLFVGFFVDYGNSYFRAIVWFGIFLGGLICLGLTFIVEYLFIGFLKFRRKMVLQKGDYFASKSVLERDDFFQAGEKGEII
ncbi:MAG: hypothetical protein PHQ47_00650 [Candidatus Portnoybacteria bacterium]|nr:hypothetical protein [Candidatus Portnoybacteria bacterium]